MEESRQELPPDRSPSVVERVVEGAGRAWRRLMRGAVSRWAAWTVLAVVAVVVLSGLILLLRPPEEPLDGFIRRWNAAVQENDERAYNSLLAGSLVELNPPAYDRGLRFLRDLHSNKLLVQPIEAQEPPPADMLYVGATSSAPEEERASLVVAYEDGPVTLELERTGWNRRWRVADVIVPPAPAGATTQEAGNGGAVALASAEAEGAGAAARVGNGTPLDTEFKVKQILEAWRVAWEQGELDAYMAWYTDYATIRRVTVVDGREIPETLTTAQLRARMERLASRYSKIEVRVANVTVQGDYAEAGMEFLQEYTGWDGNGSQQEVLYRDVGIKTLRFLHESSGWKIYEEDWRSYVSVPTYPLR
jgi:ketosteroid isomerase-like protein